MTRLLKIAITLSTCVFLASCTTTIEEYEKNTKAFDIKTYFNGNVVAWGMVQDYSAKVSRRFCVEINGSWQGNNGLLAEKFYFDDGEISYRNWQLSKLNNGSYQGTAEDVKGIAIGTHQGFAFQFQYELLLTIDNSTYEVAMDDWMYQLDDYRVFNKTAMSKLGVTVAEITLFFDKEFPNKTCDTSVFL